MILIYEISYTFNENTAINNLIYHPISNMEPVDKQKFLIRLESLISNPSNTPFQKENYITFVSLIAKIKYLTKNIFSGNSIIIKNLLTQLNNICVQLNISFTMTMEFIKNRNWYWMQGLPDTTKDLISFIGVENLGDFNESGERISTLDYSFKAWLTKKCDTKSDNFLQQIIPINTIPKFIVSNDGGVDEVKEEKNYDDETKENMQETQNNILFFTDIYTANRMNVRAQLVNTIIERLANDPITLHCFEKLLNPPIANNVNGININEALQDPNTVITKGDGDASPAREILSGIWGAAVVNLTEEGMNALIRLMQIEAETLNNIKNILVEMETINISGREITNQTQKNNELLQIKRKTDEIDEINSLEAKIKESNEQLNALSTKNRDLPSQLYKYYKNFQENVEVKTCIQTIHANITYGTTIITVVNIGDEIHDRLCSELDICMLIRENLSNAGVKYKNGNHDRIEEMIKQNTWRDRVANICSSGATQAGVFCLDRNINLEELYKKSKAHREKVFQNAYLHTDSSGKKTVYCHHGFKQIGKNVFLTSVGPIVANTPEELVDKMNKRSIIYGIKDDLFGVIGISCPDEIRIIWDEMDPEYFNECKLRDPNLISKDLVINSGSIDPLILSVLGFDSSTNFRPGDDEMILPNNQNPAFANLRIVHGHNGKFNIDPNKNNVINLNTDVGTTEKQPVMAIILGRQEKPITDVNETKTPSGQQQKPKDYGVWRRV